MRAFSNALVCVFVFFLQVAAVESVSDASQVCSTGETAKLYYPRSVHERRKDYRESRALVNNTIFAVIRKGSSNGTCADDLVQFCQLKTDFNIWNSTHLILMIKHTTFNDSGEYAVEHVFGGLTNHEKTIKFLKIEEKRATPIDPSQEFSPNSNPGNSPEPSSTSSRPPATSGAISFSAGVKLLVILCVLLIKG
ncbi:hypothetical protein OS493_020496 [Desmophyllum pertusum]|uniref:Uncharacterized protein n=1 Tax=Desmophyllum pertusum TaxID=174260 RepID=A0A9X0CQ94_9CNID|nr:hypothetical protein OS493_020496 [Desmophyllum pertusum]